MPKEKQPGRRKRVVLTLKQKMEICKRLEKGERRTVLMEEFNVGSSTIYEIKAQSQKIKQFYMKSDTEESVERRHTLHRSRLDLLDQALFEWFSLKRSEGGCISGPMLQEKGKEFYEKMNIDAHCSFSSGWLSRFKIRHGIRTLGLSSEQKSVDHEAADKFCGVFSELVAENGLTPDQIYNAAETGLMWKCLPNTTLGSTDEKVARALKQNKERITVLVCANASGSHRVKLTVVGKYAKPRCFKGITHLPVRYQSQTNALMDADIFTRWFHNIFVPSVKGNLRKKGMSENSDVILLLDHSRAHPPAEKLRNGNIFVCYLPPNVTSLIQPMNQGVIQNVKILYRRDFMWRMTNFDGTILEFQKKYSLKDAIYNVSCAWNSVKSETLRRCWQKLWPIIIFEEGSDEEDEIKGFSTYGMSKKVYDEVSELVNSAREKMPLSQIDLDEWLNVDQDAPVTHTLNTEEIIQAVKNRGKENQAEEESDEEVEEVEEVSWKSAIAAFETVIAFAEQQSFLTSQHVMQLYVMQNLTLHERRRAFKQANVRTVFKKAAQKAPSTSTALEPQPSIPTAPEPRPSTSTAPEPRPSAPTAPEPRPSAPTAPEPRPSAPTAPEPQPPSPIAPEPRPSTPTAPEPQPSTSSAYLADLLLHDPDEISGTLCPSITLILS
ncbi:jerky protein homolog [Narcine bancroftii]|uniref:jerky protein homolog n=1 Tax=Narcine bancroftii TaxID=1343680 RepID=UPI0038320583